MSTNRLKREFPIQKFNLKDQFPWKSLRRSCGSGFIGTGSINQGQPTVDTPIASFTIGYNVNSTGLSSNISSAQASYNASQLYNIVVTNTTDDRTYTTFKWIVTDETQRTETEYLTQTVTFPGITNPNPSDVEWYLPKVYEITLIVYYRNASSSAYGSIFWAPPPPEAVASINNNNVDFTTDYYTYEGDIININLTNTSTGSYDSFQWTSNTANNIPNSTEFNYPLTIINDQQPFTATITLFRGNVAVDSMTHTINFILGIIPQASFDGSVNDFETTYMGVPGEIYNISIQNTSVGYDTFEWQSEHFTNITNATTVNLDVTIPETPEIYYITLIIKKNGIAVGSVTRTISFTLLPRAIASINGITGNSQEEIIFSTGEVISIQSTNTSTGTFESLQWISTKSELTLNNDIFGGLLTATLNETIDITLNLYRLGNIVSSSTRSVIMRKANLEFTILADVNTIKVVLEETGYDLSYTDPNNQTILLGTQTQNEIVFPVTTAAYPQSFTVVYSRGTYNVTKTFLLRGILKIVNSVYLLTCTPQPQAPNIIMSGLEAQITTTNAAIAPLNFRLRQRSTSPIITKVRVCTTNNLTGPENTLSGTCVGNGSVQMQNVIQDYGNFNFPIIYNNNLHQEHALYFGIPINTSVQITSINISQTSAFTATYYSASSLYLSNTFNIPTESILADTSYFSSNGRYNVQVNGKASVSFSIPVGARTIIMLLQGGIRSTSLGTNFYGNSEADWCSCVPLTIPDVFYPRYISTYMEFGKVSGGQGILYGFVIFKD